jgi:hypothetical protein
MRNNQLGFRGAILIASLFGLSACEGEIVGNANGAGGPGSGSDTPPGRPPTGAGYKPGDPAANDRPAPSSRVARLSHTQWANTVRDLFQLDELPAIAAFRPDPKEQGFKFSTAGGMLDVDSTLWQAYQRAAEEVGAYVTSDATRLAKILPADTGDATARARTFVEEFGAKAHRRPLSTDEVDRYMELYAGAAEFFPTLPAFDAGIRLLIEAFLQSPHFVYRIEDSTAVVGTVIPLDAYEIASRLSYMLLDSMPDADLFDAARAGNLTRADIASQQANRLLQNPRAEATVLRFHSELLEFEKYSAIAPASGVFPDYSDDFGAYAREESERFFRHAIFERGANYADLLTSTETFVNSELAQAYGLSGNYGSDFTAVTLNSSQRKGFLTQVGFLASHATPVEPDIIHRGVFIARLIVCAQLKAPPDEVPPLPPADGRTNRERVAQHTENPDTVCAGCHKNIINPLGFPFENYDAVGAYRTDDNGSPVNASSDARIADKVVSVNNALELIDQLVASPAVHECYAKHWLEFAYGRPQSAADSPIIKRLGTKSKDRAISVRDLVVGLVATESFLTRSTEELP